MFPENEIDVTSLLVVIYPLSVVAIILISDILRYLRLNILSNILVCLFIVITLPLSILWFINHLILQIPSKCFIKPKYTPLIIFTKHNETLSQYMDKKMKPNRCYIPRLIIVTLGPNIAFTYIIVCIIIGINHGLTFVQKVGIPIAVVYYLISYIIYIKPITMIGYLRLPWDSILMTFKSIIMIILFIMKLFNIAGFKLFGFKEYNIYQYIMYRDIFKYKQFRYKREYSKYLKYLEWFKNERQNILYKFLNDKNVVELIIYYINNMELQERKTYDTFGSISLTMMFDVTDPIGNELDNDRNVVIRMFSLNNTYISRYERQRVNNRAPMGGRILYELSQSNSDTTSFNQTDIFTTVFDYSYNNNNNNNNRNSITTLSRLRNSVSLYRELYDFK